MSDPMSYSQSISNYIKTSPAPVDLTKFNYVIGTNPDANAYYNFYNKGLDPKTYGSEFILGHSEAAKNPNILPGNRYFLPLLDPSGSPKKCFDASGQSHDLSMAIDNVQRSNVLKDPSNQGLLYSLYASVKDYEKGLSNIDLSKNSYSCKPITVYMDDSGTKKTDVRYVLNSDTEGFIDSAAYKDVSLNNVKSYGQSVLTPGSKDLAPGALTPGSSTSGFNISNPPLLTPDGSIKKDELGIPMYQVDGTGGGPNQYNINSQSIKTNQAIMDQLLPPPGTTTGQSALSNLQKMLSPTIPGSTSGFTTIEKETKNPWLDPIFLFYVVSIGVLFVFIFYRLLIKKSRWT